MSKSRTYYIAEKEDVFQHFSQHGVTLSPALVKDLAFISKKTHNNYIGYYQFLVDDVYHKLFVIPKIYAHLSEAEKEAHFMGFLTRFYQLNNRYKDIDPRDIDGNIVDLSFDAKRYGESSQPTQAFICHKYLHAIEVLQKFFRKHNRSRQSKRSYVSQSVRHRIDLLNNIRSTDKSKVHQLRKETEAYSLLAFIAEYALSKFRQEKLGLFDTTVEEFRRAINATLNTIRKKYAVDKNFKFKDRDIITNRIAKLFKKSAELKKVYEAILILLGLEHFAGVEDARDLRKIDNMLALFFNPADLYEWVVYDALMKQYGEEATVKSGKRTETKIDYHLYSNNKEYVRSSNPDFIVLDKDGSLKVIDAKWKILKAPKDIKFADIAKLKRDYELHKQATSFEGTAILIYPKVAFNVSEENPFQPDYDLKFLFYVEEIKV